MNILLFDEHPKNLYPFTLTRPIAEIRWGILNISEKWKKHSAQVSYLTEDYLSQKYAAVYSKVNWYINARFLPEVELLKEIEGLQMEESLLAANGELIAHKSALKLKLHDLKPVKFTSAKGNYSRLEHVWDIFQQNGREIQRDYDLLTAKRKSQSISKSNTLIGNNIFLEEGAKVEASILNSSSGPIYIGKDAEVMEGCTIRGPFALGEGSTLKMAAKIYGPTSIGPQSKVGGEVNNSVIFGYSNKGHDGFLGNSVLGEWCNLGADTNTSNLKNDYGTVKIWDYEKEELMDSGQQFCGLMMGDHSKSGINTMFNTGTSVGVSANIFGAGFLEKFIPSFAWGGAEQITSYRLEKALEVAERVMQRRNVKLDKKGRDILKSVFEQTASYRKI